MRFIVFLVLMFLTTPAIANINQTTWRPDTCDCEVVYQWDSDVPSEQRIHTFISVKNEPSHVKFMSPQEKYDVILEENQRKNNAIGEIIKNFPLIDSDSISFFYDEQRKLHLLVPQLKSIEKPSTQGILNAKFGTNKVILD